MELTIIGAGPAYTDRRGAAASSYLLRAEGAAIVLDLGQGSFSNLAAELEPSGLTAVVISHLHPDHMIDLIPLRHYLKWEFEPPRRVRVLGPSRLADRLDSLLGEPGFTALALDVAALAPGEMRLGPFTLETRRVAHTDESFGFRVTAAGSSRGLVYSGDCGHAEDLAPLIRAGDTLLSEASFGAGPVPPGAEHITSGDAGRVAAGARAARLVLTHVLAGHSRDEALRAAEANFSGPVEFVTEGDRFDL